MKNMETTVMKDWIPIVVPMKPILIMGFIGTSIGLQSFIPSYPLVA